MSAVVLQFEHFFGIALLWAQIMNSLLPNSNLKKVRKTTRPFRYDLKSLMIIQWKWQIESRD